jgi:hypothetical protein
MKLILGLIIIAFGIFLEVMWLGFCFGSIVVGILLLIFAPSVLIFPFNFFLIIGLSIINGEKYREARRSKYREHTYTNAFFKPKESLDKYYEILESSKTDTLETIKKNYRRLMKQYHYDSLVSQNLSPQMIKLAEEKSQKINEAYSFIKEAKNSK